jgi:hypothetical protein
VLGRLERPLADEASAQHDPLGQRPAWLGPGDLAAADEVVQEQ